MTKVHENQVRIERMLNPAQQDFHMGFGMFCIVIQWTIEVTIHLITMKTYHILHENTCRRGFCILSNKFMIEVANQGYSYDY